MLTRRSRIAGHLSKEATVTGALGKAVGGVGRFAAEHPFLTLIPMLGIGGAAMAAEPMIRKGLAGMEPGHMRARLYRGAPPVVSGRLRPVNPLRAHVELGRKIRRWGEETRNPWSRGGFPS